jgi:cyclopropane fatty-acyl-phospholipid synthase-like methyltransferase
VRLPSLDRSHRDDLAKAFPAARFIGIDDHAVSIERARQLAADEGVGDRTHFEVRPAKELDGTFDLITVLDAFHDMGEPDRIAARLCPRPPASA